MSPKQIIFVVALIFAVSAGLLLRRIFFQPPQAPPVIEEGPPMGSEPTTTPPAAQSDKSSQSKEKPAAPKPSPQPPVSRSGMEVMAWIYPGDPTCSASREYAGKNIDILKPEYFMIQDGGELALLTEGYGCNGYSAKNITDLKKNSKEQYVTVSASYALNMDAFLNQALQDDSHINTLTNFVASNNLTGVEIDFEDFGGWNADMYSKYKQFVGKLGNALHQNNKKLMIDGPATSNQVEENWFVWRYEDFADLPVDRVVVMVYDYQYDQGVGEPISPIAWIQNTIQWTISKYPDKSKISVGIPSYGYKGQVGTQKFSILTYNQIKEEPGFSTAVLDGNSYEMTWKNGDYVYFYQNSYSMSKKLEAIKNSGVSSVSVWHLGGNQWFVSN